MGDAARAVDGKAHRTGAHRGAGAEHDPARAGGAPPARRPLRARARPRGERPPPPPAGVPLDAKAVRARLQLGLATLVALRDRKEAASLFARIPPADLSGPNIEPAADDLARYHAAMGAPDAAFTALVGARALPE